MREKAAGKGNAVFIQIMVSSLIYLLPLGFGHDTDLHQRLGFLVSLPNDRFLSTSFLGLDFTK
jgi:hypothetical protein